MFARFFIDRPIAAWVLSIVIVLAGLAAVFTLPIAQYPQITPATIQISASYPGANAVVVSGRLAAQSVASTAFLCSSLPTFGPTVSTFSTW